MSLRNLQIFAGIACIAVFSCRPGGCQIGFSSQSLMVDMRNVASVVREYYRKEGSLPASTADCDRLLAVLYKRTTRFDPGQPMPMPSSAGVFRVLDRFRVVYDTAIDQKSNLDLVWRRTPPSSWNGTAGSIGIVSNGEKRFLVFGIGENGEPLRSENGQAIYNIYDFESQDGDGERLF